MGHVTRKEAHLPPHMYASDVAVTETGLHLEFAAGLHITTLHLSGTDAEVLADLDTLTAALEDARRQLEQRAAFALYGPPRPRTAAEVAFVAAADAWPAVTA